MPVQPKSNGPYIKGIVASNQPLAQPKGSIPRGSNLVLTDRGALTPCDGSQLVHDFNGAIQSGRGKSMANFLFAPTGVPSYYLSLFKALDIPLGPPLNLTVVTSAGGTLAAATYFYIVTAIDGAGGETNGINEASIVTPVNNKNTLTWNVVPNATGYRVYRGTSSGAEVILVNPGTIPVPQAVPGSTTVSFVDDGSSTLASATLPVTGALCTARTGGGAFTTVTAIFNMPSDSGLNAGSVFTYTGQVNVGGNFSASSWVVTGLVSSTQLIAVSSGLGVSISGPRIGDTATGGNAAFTPVPPGLDNTQQTALFKMPVIVGQPAPLPVSYSNANIVALFPADAGLPIENPDGGGGGGPGGGGGTGGGGTGGGSGSGSHTTPSGGIPGNVTLIPQMKQFTNRVIIALGNGFPMQIYSDASGTPINPATIAGISNITVDAFGVVTVTTSVPHGLVTAQVGANVLLAGVANALYNGAFPTINIISSTQFQVRNLAAIGQAASGGGTSTTTAVPVISTFTPAFPQWTSTTPLIVGDVIQPATQPAQAIYLTVTQSGTTGAAEPAWPSTGLAAVGQSVSSGSVIFQVSGLLNSAAPPPPGAAHIEIYSGALFVFNTSPSNTANGLDGPCSLRQSAFGNPNSWNPINQAFLDKDDGTEGTGLAKFTITAQGIPPEGSLVSFKNFQPYQIIGVFGATTFAIQAISSDMGCIAPRTLQFVPGFGIMRYTHLGMAVFNGVQDTLVSEQIRPYLFPTNDATFKDIVVLDASWQAVMWGFQTANPPMYCVVAPIGQSGGQLTRIFGYDLVLKAWIVVDLPFPISTAAQFKSISANPVSILGGFSDGCLSRWQAGDVQWDVGGSGARTPSNVTFSMRTLTAASQDVDQRIYVRRLAMNLVNSGGSGTISVTPRLNGIPQQAMSFYVPANQDFDVDAAIGLTGKRIDCDISSSLHATIIGDAYELEPRPIGVLVGI